MIRGRLDLSETIAYPNQTFDSAFSANANMQLSIDYAEAVNGTAGPNDVGIAHSMNTSDVDSELSGNNYVISADRKFNLVALNVGTADTSGASFTYTYWNGSSFVALSLINEPLLTSTGKKAILFSAPLDWAADAGNQYTIRIEGSGTPNFALSGIKICRLLAYRKDVASNGTLRIYFDKESLLLQQGEDIIGFFSFPHAANTLKAAFKNSP